MMLRHVDLCSGIGGFSLGFEWAQLSTPILFCDTEPWCRKILAKNFPNVPIATDVKELANDPERLVPDCDILTAGYPCQPFSVAGKQKGTEDDRHIWPYIFRIVTQKRPTWCVFENVHGHIAMGLDEVLADLESEGYATRTFIVPACGVNAPHKRDRLWIVGYAEHDGSSTSKIRGSNEEDARGASQGQIQAKQSSGASGREDDVTLADTNSDDGRNGSSTKSQGRHSRMEHRSGSQRQPIQEPNKNVADTTILGLQEHGHSKSDEFVDVSEDVADTNNARQSSSSGRGQNSWNEEGNDIGRSGENVADTSGEGSQGRLSGRSGSERQSFVGQSGCSSSTYGQSGEDWWAVEPNVRRVAHGIPKRVDRIKGLGNAIVPQIAMNIGLAIKEQL